ARRPRRPWLRPRRRRPPRSPRRHSRGGLPVEDGPPRRWRDGQPPALEPWATTRATRSAMRISPRRWGIRKRLPGISQIESATPSKTCTRMSGSRVTPHPVDEQRVEAVCERVGVATGLEPRVGPVRRAQEEERRRGFVKVGPELRELAPFAEEV